jgi:MoaA/NifB/PqqE/SkfB family radical SAM enzyme
MTTQKVFCTAPWAGFTVRENGQVLTCCVGKIPLGNLNQQSIDSIVKSPTLVEIQKKMLSGESNLENCKFCIDEQKKSGVAGLQQHYNRFYPTFDPDQVKLKCLDIRWHNTCNLGCVYCTPTFSSVWQDRLKIKRSTVVKDYQDELLEWILDRSSETEEITLVGGEPMLMKQNYSLINQLSDQCRISIITNLSYDLSRLPCITKMLSRPKENTIWNVSLDNIGKQFEYVRNGSSWQQVSDNLQYLNQHWNNLVNINLVYSMFSAFDIVKTVQVLHQLGFKKINFVSINENPSVDVFNMPEPIRQAAAEQLQLTKQWHFENIHPEDKDFYPLNGLDAMLDHLSGLNVQSTITKDTFFDKIKWYDQYNTQKFQDLWPNVIDLVEKYL